MENQKIRFLEISIMLFLIGCFLPLFLQAQQTEKLTLPQAYQLAEQHYPVIKQRELIKQTEEISLENLNKGYLPQLSFNAQATYQSDVTTVQSPVPGIEFVPPSKAQYKATADITQVLYDGGSICQQKKIQQLSAKVETQKTEVELYKLKDRINQLYLGILLLDEQIKQTNLVQQDLQGGINKVTAQVQNGLVFKSNLYVLQAELLKAQQRTIEVKATRKGIIQTLSLFLDLPISEYTVFEKPFSQEVNFTAENQRPELKLYTFQSELLQQQNHLVRARNLPKLSLFAQGGYGRPGLNMLLNEFDWFYLGGVRLNWNLNGFYTYRNEKKLTGINQQLVQVQRETFLLNTNTILSQQQAEIEKLQQLITTDNAIIELRDKVKNAAEAQLENNVINANDFLREVNAKDQARQMLLLHQLQLLQAQLNYQATTGQ